MAFFVVQMIWQEWPQALVMVRMVLTVPFVFCPSVHLGLDVHGASPTLPATLPAGTSP